MAQEHAAAEAIISKSALMRAVAEGCMHECFQHSEEGAFDITHMRHWAKANLVPVPIYITDIIDHIRSSRVIEESRVASLSREDAWHDPAIIIIYSRPGEEVSHLMIDGHHRAIRLHNEGESTQLAYLFTEEQIIRPPENYLKELDWGSADLVGDQLVERG